MTTTKLIKRLLLVSLATVFSGSILADNLSESKSVDVSKLTGSDNQLLIQIDNTQM